MTDDERTSREAPSTQGGLGAPGWAAFRGAAFRGAAFRWAAIRGAAFRGAAFRGAAFRGAAFRGAAIRWFQSERLGPRASRRIFVLGYNHLAKYRELTFKLQKSPIFTRLQTLGEGEGTDILELLQEDLKKFFRRDL